MVTIIVGKDGEFQKTTVRSEGAERMAHVYKQMGYKIILMYGGNDEQ